MGWFFGRSKPEPQKIELSAIQAWKNVIDRQKSDIFNSAKAIHKEILSAFIELERSFSHIQPKHIEDRRIAQILVREKQNITKRAQSIIRSFTKKTFPFSKAALEQFYEQCQAVVGDILTPKQIWLLNKYFVIDHQPFKLLQEVLIKFGNFLSNEAKFLDFFDKIERIIEQILLLEKNLTQYKEQKRAIENEIGKFMADRLRIEKEIEQLRQSRAWADAQIVVAQIEQARMESNHLKAIITSKAAIAKKIIQKSKSGITQEQAVKLEKIKAEIREIKKKLSHIREPIQPEIINIEKKLVEGLSKNKFEMDKLLATSEKCRLEIEKIEAAIKENIKILEQLAQKIGQRIVICQ
jgi:hypothetical protein